MKFMELTYRQRSHTGGADILEKFMKDMEGSGWEIYDRGTDSANWVNNHMGMNHHVAENYTELKAKFTRAGLMLDLDNIASAVELEPKAKLDLDVAVLALQEAKQGFEAIMSGLTTDINRVEEMTKRRANQHYIEVVTALQKILTK